MKYRITEENGVYDLLVYSEDTLKENEEVELGNLLIDTKRNQYYILPAEEQSEEMQNIFKTVVMNGFVKKLGTSINPESRVGEIKSYSKDILSRLLKENSVEDNTYKSMEEKAINSDIYDIRSYNLGTLEEYNIYGQLR